MFRRHRNNFGVKISLLAILALLCFFFSLPVSVSAYDFSVTIPEGEVLEVKLFNSDGTTMGSTTSMNVTPTSLSSPGFNEKDVVVSVGTSNEWGYNLVMNVSNTTPTSEQDPNNTIANLTNKSGGYTCTPETAATCDFTVNSWGFKIKTATNTQEATNYIPVPTAINLNTNNTTTNGDPVYLSFGSRINAFQKSGTYSTTINFVATAKPDPTPLMQNMTQSTLASLMSNNGSTTTLKDSRDGKTYQVTNINGTYWMTQNLRITNSSGKSAGVISADGSNFTGSDIQMVSSSGSQFRDYTVLRYYDSGDTTTGVYYSYCAATAGTVCVSGINVNAQVDICPAGWRLATHTEFQNVAAYGGTNWNPVTPGWYNSGVYESNVAAWWGSTSHSAYRSWGLLYVPNSGGYNADGAAISRDSGINVRCIFGGV